MQARVAGPLGSLNITIKSKDANGMTVSVCRWELFIPETKSETTKRTRTNQPRW